MADVADDDGNPRNPGQAAFMGVVLVCMFLCLFFGVRTPETVVSALRVAYRPKNTCKQRIGKALWTACSRYH